jgi:AcrR family transcriptional regulator
MTRPLQRPPIAWPQLVWARPMPAERTQPPLSRSQIVKAAMAIADREGLEAVTMRRIAAALGSGTASLYWHVPSKQDLYELMFDEYIGEFLSENRVPEHRSGDWRADLREVWVEARRAMQRHPWVPQLGIQLGLGPRSLRNYAFMTSILDGLGLDDETVVMIPAVLVNYVMGFAQNDAALAEAQQRSGQTSQEWAQGLADYVSDALADDPRAARLVAKRMTLSRDRAFEFGLDCLLDGIAARLSRQRGGEKTTTARRRA